jgi:hypothetical protein
MIVWFDPRSEAKTKIAGRRSVTFACSVCSGSAVHVAPAVAHSHSCTCTVTTCRWHFRLPSLQSGTAQRSAAQRNAGFGLGLGLELPPAVQFQLQSQSRVGKCLQLEARHGREPHLATRYHTVQHHSSLLPLLQSSVDILDILDISYISHHRPPPSCAGRHCPP